MQHSEYVTSTVSWNDLWYRVVGYFRRHKFLRSNAKSWKFQNFCLTRDRELTPTLSYKHRANCRKPFWKAIYNQLTFRHHNCKRIFRVSLSWPTATYVPSRFACNCFNVVVQAWFLRQGCHFTCEMVSGAKLKITKKIFFLPCLLVIHENLSSRNFPLYSI